MIPLKHFPVFARVPIQAPHVFVFFLHVLVLCQGVMLPSLSCMDPLVFQIRLGASNGVEFPTTYRCWVPGWWRWAWSWCPQFWDCVALPLQCLIILNFVALSQGKHCSVCPKQTTTSFLEPDFSAGFRLSFPDFLCTLIQKHPLPLETPKFCYGNICYGKFRPDSCSGCLKDFKTWSFTTQVGASTFEFWKEPITSNVPADHWPRSRTRHLANSFLMSLIRQSLHLTLFWP